MEWRYIGRCFLSFYDKVICLKNLYSNTLLITLYGNLPFKHVHFKSIFCNKSWQNVTIIITTVLPTGLIRYWRFSFHYNNRIIKINWSWIKKRTIMQFIIYDITILPFDTIFCFNISIMDTFCRFAEYWKITKKDE